MAIKPNAKHIYIMANSKIILSHIWVNNFGWENTVRTTEDYSSVIHLAELDEVHSENKHIFMASFEDGTIELVRGDYN